MSGEVTPVKAGMSLGAGGPPPLSDQVAGGHLREHLCYENVIVQKKTQILNDCLREMLLFPYDDFQVRVNSTVRSSFTNSSFLSLGLLLG